MLKYSDEYGFGIAGTYTSLQFATTPNGARISITPVGGVFTVPSDGYVFVNGGNTTDTAIWMQWSDWTDSYEGSFAVYTEYTVDLSTVMSEIFPNGLCSVGSVRDEININAGEAIQRIERLEYTEENIEEIIASGRAYDADENYIYAVLDDEVSYEIDIDGSYTSNDHGMEFFEGTEVPVYTQALYGENLIDKLRTDVLTKSGDLVNNLTTTVPGKALDARQGKVLSENLADLSSTATRKNTGSWLGVSNCIAVQIDANRIMGVIHLPYIATKTFYTISDVSATILTIGTFEATIEGKNTTDFRFVINRSGTVGQAFVCGVEYRITL